MELRKLQATESTLNSLPLPDELLEAIFHRLHITTLLHAKQVCREWRRVLQSASFTGTYRSTATLVQEWMVQGWTAGYILAEVIAGNVLRVRKEWDFGRSACPETGLLAGLSHSDNMFFVGNLFTNKWDVVPPPPSREWFNRDNLAVFGFGDGRYKLVYWDYRGDLYTRESGEQEWTKQWSERWSLLGGIIGVIGNSLFRLDHNNKKLLEYNILDKVIKRTALDREIPEVDDFDEKLLIAWENKLYLFLILSRSGADGVLYQRMTLWRISTIDGASTLVMQHEIKEPHVSSLRRVDIKDGRLEVPYRSVGTKKIRLICNMETKEVEVLRTGERFQRFMTVPVRLC